MTCLGPYEIFSHLMFYCYRILCFSMSNYLNAYKLFLFILTALLNVFSPSEIVCCVFKFYWFSDEGDLLLKLKYCVIIS